MLLTTQWASTRWNGSKLHTPLSHYELLCSSIHPPTHSHKYFVMLTYICLYICILTYIYIYIYMCLCRDQIRLYAMKLLHDVSALEKGSAEVEADGREGDVSHRDSGTLLDSSSDLSVAQVEACDGVCVCVCVCMCVCVRALV
jgi:hypothetical protein